MSRTAIEIGTFELRAPYELRQTFETASWSRTLQIEPGTYPVIAYFNPGESFPSPSSISIRVEGECSASYFEARIFQHRSSNVDEDVGKRFTDAIRWPSYDLAGLEDLGELKLDESVVRIEEWECERTRWDSELKRSVPAGSETLRRIRRKVWRFPFELDAKPEGLELQHSYGAVYSARLGELRAFGGPREICEKLGLEPARFE